MPVSRTQPNICSQVKIRSTPLVWSSRSGAAIHPKMVGQLQSTSQGGGVSRPNPGSERTFAGGCSKAHTLQIWAGEPAIGFLTRGGGAARARVPQPFPQPETQRIPLPTPALGACWGPALSHRRWSKGGRLGPEVGSPHARPDSAPQGFDFDENRCHGRFVLRRRWMSWSRASPAPEFRALRGRIRADVCLSSPLRTERSGARWSTSGGSSKISGPQCMCRGRCGGRR